MIEIRGIKLLPGESEALLRERAARALHIDSGTITALAIRRKSLDARKKHLVFFHYTVEVAVSGSEEKILRRSRNPSAKLSSREVYRVPQAGRLPHRPVVAGFGPAGMFAALILAEAGTRPIVLERGEDANTRRQKVMRFWEAGELDPECNVQFGEGGAGTFSDGKLTTGTKDFRIGWVLEQLVRFGAPEQILYDALPHIGTDILVGLVQNLRSRILELGGEVRFGQRLDGLRQDPDGLCGVSVHTAQGTYLLPCRQLILAVGHSARDTFEMLHRAGLPLLPKPFSMGVRIEHGQEAINRAQYGNLWDHPALPPAVYKLSCRLPSGESAYTFCMCPGGYVVAAASESGGVVTNGMSESKRDAENANAALLVTLSPEDYPDKSPLGGMYWQREIEQAAFQAGGCGYRAPAQRVGDFLAGRPTTDPGGVKPSYRPGVIWSDLRLILPPRITDTLAEALPRLDAILPGFADPDAVLTAPETRSSSPVRIVRNEHREAPLSGIFPCGEGAGYAGGIVSAAVDGMRCAESLLRRAGVTSL